METLVFLKCNNGVDLCLDTVLWMILDCLDYKICVMHDCWFSCTAFVGAVFTKVYAASSCRS